MIIQKLINKYQAEIDLRIENIMILTNNPVGVPEHPDMAATITSELEMISHYYDLIEAARLVLQENNS